MAPQEYRNLLVNVAAGAIYQAALAAADPRLAVIRGMGLAESCLSSGNFDKIIVLGAGKASARMALGVEQQLGKRISAGIIIATQGCREQLSFIDQIEASHPIPDEAGLKGTAGILELARDADERTLVICLLSGGASSLLVSPAAGVSLEDKQKATRLLMHAGASISELNTVRKHLSGVKGGKLATAAFPAKIISLILSDVIGNRLDVIASGPTCADVTTFEEALTIISKYALTKEMPECVMTALQEGVAGLRPETAKPGDPRLGNAVNLIVGDIGLALSAAEMKARGLGFETRIITKELQGDAREASKFLAHIARNERNGAKRRICLLCGGETTVTVRGNGKGGRNQELALAFSLEIEGLEGISLLSAGTDGIDGPTDASGAVVDGKTAETARRLGLSPLQYLENNDSWSFFEQYDALAAEARHFKTGPTGTNVMDLQIILIE